MTEWRVLLEPMTWASSTLVVVEHPEYGRAEMVVNDRLVTNWQSPDGKTTLLENVADQLKNKLMEVGGQSHSIHVDRFGQVQSGSSVEHEPETPVLPPPPKELTPEQRKAKLSKMLHGAKVNP